VGGFVNKDEDATHACIREVKEEVGLDLPVNKVEQLLTVSTPGRDPRGWVITIAHRLNTIQDMERIVVMDKGQVVSKGTHQELMKDCSLYRNMTETQEQVSKWQLKEEEVMEKILLLKKLEKTILKMLM